MKFNFLSPVMWFCGPFVFALIVLGTNDQMPFYDYYPKALEVTVPYILLPFLLCYFGGMFMLFSISGIKSHVNSGIQFNLIKIKPFLIIWLLISVVEMLVFPGLPIFYIVTGGNKTYAEFGIPSVHGVANLLWLILAMIVYTRWRKGESHARWLVLGLVSWPLLCASRGLFIIMALILLSVHLMLIDRVKLKFFLILAVFLPVVYLGFGFLGDIRAKEFSLTAALGISDDIHTAWLWFYVYLTAPLANLVNTMEMVSPSFSLVPVATLGGVIPTILKPLLGVEIGFDAYIGEPIAAFLNAGTAFRPAYLDWGILGIVVVSAGFGVLAARIRHRANRFGGLALAFLNVMLLLNIFNNNFIVPTFLLTFFILLYLEAKAYRQQRKLRLSQLIEVR